MKPLISVVLPIYNVEAYLEQCLDSLLSQEFENFEVVAVDDCSTDKSVLIFERYLSDKRFNLIRHHENLGLPSARNTALFFSKGDFVYLLDSDDWVSPVALGVLHDLAVEDNCDIAIGGLVRYEEDTGQMVVPPNHYRTMERSIRKKTIFEDASLFHSVAAGNKLIRLNYIKETGLIYKCIPRRFEDMLTYKWYLTGAQVSSVSEITYFYRQRAKDSKVQSITQHRDLDMYADKFLAYADILRFVIKKGFLDTASDPLHSSNAMMNLPKALSWTIPNVFCKENLLSKSDHIQDEMLKVILSLKMLCSIFPEEYHERLPKRIQSYLKGITGYSADKFLDIVRNKFV